MQQEPKCTLTNEEPIEKVKEWNISLAKSGGKAWTLQIPANVNEDPDLLIGELITRFKALLKPGAQSAGTWVKASERLPPNDMADDFPKKYITRCKDDGWRGQALVYSLNYEEIKMANTQYDYTEWLHEAALPDNKDREEQAEWEFIQILKENYEAAKRSDEYHFEGKTKKEAVVETYEDLFEIIKGLPLKRQKVDFSFVNNNKEREESFADWLDQQRNDGTGFWCDNKIWLKENAFKKMYEKWQQSLTNKP